jgi:tetratricopeptide (TPR) repeat protein/predicted aspartyl protease
MTGPETHGSRLSLIPEHPHRGVTDDIRCSHRISPTLSVLELQPAGVAALAHVSAPSGRALPIALALSWLLTSPMPAFSGCTLAKLAELPVTMQGLKPVVPVKINGADAHLIADSGAYGSTLSPGSAAVFNLKLEPPPYPMRVEGIGGSSQLSVTRVRNFMLANIPVNNVLFLVGGNEWPGAAGVLGQNVLRIADVEYDLAAGVIRLMRPKGCGKETLAYWAQSEPVTAIDIEPTNALFPHTISTAYVNGTRIHVMFDSGSTASMLSLRAAERAGVKPNGAGVVPAGFVYGFGEGRVQTWIAPFASFKLGDEEIRNTHLRIGDTGRAAYADMLLGADFFLSHRIYVSNDQSKVYFTYNGGKVFNLATTPQKQADSTPSAAEPAAAGAPAPPEPAGAEPTSAAEFSQRGTAFAARRDFEHALADLTRACELAPEEPAYFYQRGLVHWSNRQPDLALVDFDHALTLKPDDLEALMARARLRLIRGDAAGAGPDLDAADRLAPKAADLRLALGEYYGNSGQMARAIAQYDLWIAAHRGEIKFASALNSRCWARALLGRELDKALDDCNAAVRTDPKTAQFLDSRGLVWLRRGDYKKSKADYDAALSLDPKLAWSLYGRGVDQLRLGNASAGQADIAAATALRPKIAEEAGKFGIAP